MTMIDLARVSGLPLLLDVATGQLADPSGSLLLEPPGSRRFAELREVVAEPDAIGLIEEEIAYLTYRGVQRIEDDSLASRGLRHDVTVTLPGTVGREFVKTAGHYHGLHANGIGWPEIYDVLAGSAVFVLQRADGDPAGSPLVTRGVAIVAEAGDRLVIPPGYGHVTVNTGSAPLAVADLVAVASTNHYVDYRARRGAAIRAFAVADGRVDWAWNAAYPAVDSDIEVVRAAELPSFAADVPLYRLGVEQADRVAFLTEPVAFDLGDETDSVAGRR